MAGLTAILIPLALGAQRSSVRSDSVRFAGATVLPLGSGLTPVDLLGDGTPGIAFVSYRENFNAHGFHLLTLALRKRDSADTAQAWQTVPVFGPGEREQDMETTVEGADCTLRDVRLVRRRGTDRATLLIAERAFGRSFADAAPVTIRMYELRHNDDGVFGWPAWYFAEAGVVRPHRAYCDVDVALYRELGIGVAGLARSEALHELTP